MDPLRLQPDGAMTVSWARLLRPDGQKALSHSWTSFKVFLQSMETDNIYPQTFLQVFASIMLTCCSCSRKYFYLFNSGGGGGGGGLMELQSKVNGFDIEANSFF